MHVRIAARDPARAAAFYAACFGWEVMESAPGGVEFRAPGGLCGSFWTGGEPTSAGAELFVAVARLEASITSAIARGAMRIARPGPGPGGSRVAQLLDPEGNRVCLWELPAPSEQVDCPDGKQAAGPGGKAPSRE